MIAKVIFVDSNTTKHYDYFWPENTSFYKKGTHLLINTNHGIERVKITGWTKDSVKANKIIDIVKVFHNNNQEEEVIEMESKFSRTKNITVQTLNENKDIVVKMQKGKAVITALKTSAIQSDLLNPKMKELLTVPGYSDMAIGMMLKIAAESMTHNKVVQDAAEAANFVGAVEFSNQFTFLEKLITDTITKALSTVTESVDEVK